MSTRRKERATTAVLRFGLGAGPGEIAEAQTDPTGYLLDQLNRNAELVSAPGESSGVLIEEFRSYLRSMRNRDSKMKRRKGMHPAALAYQEAVGSRIATWSASQTPFLERLSLFWSNHFTVSARRPLIAATAGAFEREAIRPHITGSFSDMLVASSRHPAMLLYLDNARSKGPNSKVGKQTGKGVNENLAREILELHTVGVTGGYDLGDIRELAMALTGWSVAGPRSKRAQPGSYVFRYGTHEPGLRKVMSKVYRLPDNEKKGEEILRDLARHPATAQHISFKLARHFIADNPPADLVENMAKTFLDTEGDLAAVYRALLEQKHAFEIEFQKFKTPIHLIASLARGLNASDQHSFLAQGLEIMGQRLWAAPSPQGWSDERSDWISSDALATRFDFLSTLAQRSTDQHEADALAHDLLGTRYDKQLRTEIKRAASPHQAITLLLMSPAFQHS